MPEKKVSSDKQRNIHDLRNEIQRNMEPVLEGKIPALTADTKKPIADIVTMRSLTEDLNEVTIGVDSMALVDSVHQKQIFELEPTRFFIQEKRDEADKIFLDAIENYKKDRKYFAKRVLSPLFRPGTDPSAKGPLNMILPKIHGQVKDFEMIQGHIEKMRKLLTAWNAYIAPPETNVPKAQELLAVDKSKIGKDLYDILQENLSILANKKEIFIIEFIMDAEFEKTVKKLQLISYLTSLKIFSLKDATANELDNTGKYKLVRTSKEEANNFSVIFGITQDDWQYLKSLKGNYKNRKKIQYLD